MILILDPKPLFDWANEREHIRIAKDAGEPSPWTSDEILKTYRFCNVYREQDRVTKWVKENVRDAYADSPNLWIMILLTRIINWPPTIDALITNKALPLQKYNGPKVTAVLEEYQALHTKTFTSAYMVRAESNPKVAWYDWTKCRYIAEIVVQRAWKKRKVLAPLAHGSIKGFVQGLQECYGIGPFIAYQTAVDLTWCPGWLDKADDLNSWAQCGPGTKRGLNRLAGRQISANPKEAVLLAELEILYEDQHMFIDNSYMETIRLSDITNCLCEYDKYERVRLGQGRPRSKYVEGRGC